MTVVVKGVVVEGDHRGRTLGFPTANLEANGLSAETDEGVYAGIAIRADGSRYVAAISIGRRPHYYGDEAPVVVEAHLLDFDGDLYGEILIVDIRERIRGQLRFDTEETLRRQIADDVAAVHVWSDAVADLVDN